MAPVILVYGLLAVFEKEWLWGAVLIAAGFAAIGLYFALLAYAKKNFEGLPFMFSGVEVADRESIGILLLYLLPLLRTSFADLELLIVVPASAIFLALALTGHNYHFNPLLSLLGWNFFKVSTPEGVGYLLITRKSIRSLPGDGLTLVQLTEYTVVDLGD